MGQIDSFGDYVRKRLDEWGDEFALHRDCEYLGHHSKNMLQILVEHKGEMPGRVVGFKPQEVSLPALEIERIVAEIGKDQPRIACCLRAHFCGSGRRKVERLEMARQLIAKIEGSGKKLPNIRQHLAMVSEGISMVRGALIGIAQAA